MPKQYIIREKVSGKFYYSSDNADWYLTSNLSKAHRFKSEEGAKQTIEIYNFDGNEWEVLEQPE